MSQKIGPKEAQLQAMREDQYNRRAKEAADARKLTSLKKEIAAMEAERPAKARKGKKNKSR